MVELLPEREPRRLTLEEPGGHHPCAVGDRPDRLVQRPVRTGHLERDVGSTPTGQLADALADLPVTGLHRVGGAERLGDLEPAVVGVDGDHLGAVQARQLGDDLAGHPEAEHGDRLADMDVRIQHHVEGDGADL